MRLTRFRIHNNHWCCSRRFYFAFSICKCKFLSCSNPWQIFCSYFFRQWSYCWDITTIHCVCLGHWDNRLRIIFVFQPVSTALLSRRRIVIPAAVPTKPFSGMNSTWRLYQHLLHGIYLHLVLHKIRQRLIQLYFLARQHYM